MITPAPTETPFHHWVEIIITTSIPVVFSAIAVGLQKLFSMGKTITNTALEVNVIKTNHLVHLDQKIDGVVDDMRELRGQFIDHIQNIKD